MMMTANSLVARPACWLPVLALALCGCGGRGEVSGTVRFNGKPLSAGRVTLVSVNQPGVVAYSSILADGSYKVAGCPAGPVKVAVQTVVPRTSAGATGNKAAAGPKVPVRYADPSTSGLEYTVHRGQQPYDIDLTR
jgi:hypothetical protein